MSNVRIAIVRLSALGDIINSVVVLQFIRRRYPDIKIDWITEQQFVPLLQGHPEIDAVHGIPLKQLKREKRFSLLRAVIRRLRALGPYDLVIDMQGLLKSAMVSRLAATPVHGFDAASARESIAALFYTSKSRIPYEANIIRRNCDLIGDALDFHISDEEILAKSPALPVGKRPDFPEMPSYVAIIVGASWASKCYPPEQYARICDALPKRCVLIWGSETEEADARIIAALSNNAHAAPAFSLPELRDVIGHAALVIGGDTGPTHLAWALNRPSVVLYGPTTPRMMFETDQNVAIKSDAAVDIRSIDKNDMSIRTIPAESIIDRALELL